MSRKDYYGALGVSRSANRQEIKDAYRDLAKRFHPDVNPGFNAYEERFKEIAEAYAVLSDDEQRHLYDSGRLTPLGEGFGAEVSPEALAEILSMLRMDGARSTGGGGGLRRRSHRLSRMITTIFGMAVIILMGLLGTWALRPLEVLQEFNLRDGTYNARVDSAQLLWEENGSRQPVGGAVGLSIEGRLLKVQKLFSGQGTSSPWYMFCSLAPGTHVTVTVRGGEIEGYTPWK